MKTIPILLCGAALCCLALSSCTKHLHLEEKRAEMEAECATLMDQIHDLDMQIKALPTSPRTLSSLLGDAEQKRKAAAKSAPAATSRMKKWTAVENALKALQERTRAYAAAAN